MLFRLETNQSQFGNQSQSGRLVAVLHQELRSLDFLLKILYHLMCGEKVWSDASPSVKAKASEAYAEAIKRIKLSCGGLLIDSPMTQGGTSNTGPVARCFFHPSNREALCNQIQIEIIGRILQFFLAS